MARLFKKARKPRGYKLTGERSQDMCTGCLSFGCDPMADSPAWDAKKRRRAAAGLCRSCGHNPCTCKSTLSKPYRKELKDCTSLKNRKLTEAELFVRFVGELYRETGMSLHDCHEAAKKHGKDKAACIQWLSSKETS